MGLMVHTHLHSTSRTGGLLLSRGYVIHKIFVLDRFSCFIIDQFLEFFTWLEVRNPLGRDIDRCPCLWISPTARVALAYAERPETPQFDLFSTIESLNNIFKNFVYNHFRVFLS